MITSNLYGLHGSRTTESTHHKRDEMIYNESFESKYHQKVKEIQNKKIQKRISLIQNESFFDFLWNDFCKSNDAFTFA